MKIMKWENLLNSNRLGNRAPKNELGRSEFHSDHDKVIFSGSFRRLARKTQVHPLATNDHIHNRLTHSLEVACVGRTLALRVGADLENENLMPDEYKKEDIADIVQTACLAHDIGNPPFGHTGEEAIRHWFKSDKGAVLIKDLDNKHKSDLEKFEGNAQGLRILTTSEYHPYDDGMRLTYASLASFIKYPWLSFHGGRPKSNKYGAFNSESNHFESIARATGLIQRGDNWYCRHPLAHLMEMADDFCYAIIDLEDGLEMGIISWEEMYAVIKPVLDDRKAIELNAELGKVSNGRKPPLIRGKVISAFVDAGANAFIKNHDSIMRGEHDEILSLCDESVRKCIIEAKSLTKNKIFQHPKKVELEIGAYNTIATVLDVLCTAAISFARNSESISYKDKRALDLIGTHTFPTKENSACSSDYEYECLMRAMDFVSGMSDNYISHIARQFSGIGGSR